MKGARDDGARDAERSHTRAAGEAGAAEGGAARAPAAEGTAGQCAGTQPWQARNASGRGRRSKVVGASPSTPPQPSSTDCDGDEWTLLLSLLGLRIRWADRTAGVTEVVERTKDEFPEWTRILRDTIDAIRPLAEDVSEKQRGLTEMLRSPAPDPEVIDTLKLAIEERRGQIDRLGRE